MSGETKKEKAATSFHGEYLILERLSLLLHFQFVVLDVAQFTLNSFSQLVQSLRLLLELVYLVLFVLRTYSLIRTSTAVVGFNPVLSGPRKKPGLCRNPRQVPLPRKFCF